MNKDALRMHIAPARISTDGSSGFRGSAALSAREREKGSEMRGGMLAGGEIESAPIIRLDEEGVGFAHTSILAEKSASSRLGPIVRLRPGGSLSG